MIPQHDGTILSIAVIGSSGGGTATLGHTNAPHFLETIELQLNLLGATIGAALFVSLDDGKGMDSLDHEFSIDKATLYQVLEKTDNSSKFNCIELSRGALGEINKVCAKEQQKIAELISNGRIHGLICISCHAILFRDIFQAATIKKIPVTGSGGTSLSQVSSLYNLVLIGNAGGSVATTSFTRAVSYACALARHWKRPYEPWKQGDSCAPTFRSVLNSCLPVFWAVCIAKHILLMEPTRYLAEYSHLSQELDSVLLLLQSTIIPSACSVIMALSAVENTSKESLSASSVIMASMIASMASRCSLLNGLLAGWCVSKLSIRCMYFCVFHNVPTTYTNLLASGGIGVLVLIPMMFLAPALRYVTESTRLLILLSLSFSDKRLRAAMGFFWGVLSCYGSKVGWYHSIHLPMILMEMELADASFLGAIDELTLVLVSAGICMAVIVTSMISPNRFRRGDITLCKRGLATNLICGDFIEVCYPYTEQSQLINAGAYLASGASTAWLVLEANHSDSTPRSLAYLPVVVSIALANKQWLRMTGACVIAMGVPFLVSMIQFLAFSRKSSKGD